MEEAKLVYEIYKSKETCLIQINKSTRMEIEFKDLI